MGMGDALRIGFIGGGLESAVGYAHFSATRLDGRFELVAGCFSRDPERNAVAAERFGVRPDRVHSSALELLASEGGELDAVVILTPTPTHVDMVGLAIEAGLPVVCEKALAGTSAEAERLGERVRAQGGFLAVVYNYSGYPAVRELRRLIDAGTLGRIRHIQVEMPQEGYARTGPDGVPAVPQAWRLRDGYIPTLHLDLAVHLHQLVWYLLRRAPVRVLADHSSHGNFDVIDNAMALARYQDGITANIWFSKAALGHRNGLRLRIFGEEGSAEWVQEEPERLRLASRDGRVEVSDRGSPTSVIATQPRYARFKAGHPGGFIEGLANFYADVADALQLHLTGQPSDVSGEVFGADLAAEGLRLFEAMSDSVRSGRWEAVRLP